jgi:hypothetical protein
MGKYCILMVLNKWTNPKKENCSVILRSFTDYFKRIILDLEIKSGGTLESKHS